MIAVPYIAKEKIEEEAAHLLVEAYKGLNIALDGPVDVETIIECYLGLSISIATLDTEILGALYLVNKLIEINERILPDNDKRCTGVFNFTLGHEGGHYVMHAPPLAANDQNVICRKSDEYLDIEWQANFFASALLMPREPFIKAFNERYPELIYRDAERLLIKCFADKNIAEKFNLKDKDFLKIQF